MNVQFSTQLPAPYDRQWQWEGRRMTYVVTACLLLLLGIGELVSAMVGAMIFWILVRAERKVCELAT